MAAPVNRAHDRTAMTSTICRNIVRTSFLLSTHNTLLDANVVLLRSLISSWEPFLFSCPRFWKSLFLLHAAADPQSFHLVNKRCPLQPELRGCPSCASDHPISILQYS